MIRALPDRLLLDTLRTLRHTLHTVPEPAGHESSTAAVVASFLATYAPDELLTELGGHGVAAVFQGREPGPTVMVRCELDALPVEEEEAGASTASDGADHRCGHDGHMAIVAGLAPLLHYDPPRRGRVVLLFQPAEETGEGALRIVEDEAFVRIQPDAVVGLHNLPGYPTDAVVVRDGLFTAASTGLHVRLDGAAAHAAEPEHGVTPAPAVAELLQRLPTIAGAGEDGQTVTVTHAQLGRPSFGLSPGHAEVRTTLRARTSEALGALRATAEALVIEAAESHRVVPTISWHETFPETRNDEDLVERLAEACRASGLPFVALDAPFAWSEDFGVYAERWPALFFGLGIGEQAIPLHQRGYSFPDESIETGLRLFAALVAAIGERWAQRRDARSVTPNAAGTTVRGLASTG